VDTLGPRGRETGCAKLPQNGEYAASACTISIYEVWMLCLVQLTCTCSKMFMHACRMCALLPAKDV
jgi:hypothetical protein